MYLICRDLLSWSPLVLSGYEFGVIRVLIAITFLLSISVVLFWIHKQERKVKLGYSEDSILFPHFIRLLYLIAVVDCFTLLILLIAEVVFPSSLTQLTIISYCLTGACQHVFTEGIAFLFLQKGCGYYAFQRTRVFACYWFILSFFIYYLLYSPYLPLKIIGWLLWLTIAIFYYLLWLLPSKLLFRRSAAKPYGKCWAIYKTALFLSYGLLYLRSETHGAISYGYCGVYAVGFFGYALLHPLIIYWALRDDSRWWQGIMESPLTPHTSRQSSLDHTGDQMTDRNHNGGSVTNMRTPLIGADLSLVAAITLAGAVDRMGANNSTIQVLNFAHIQLTSQRKLLGIGSFSKVYRGVYKKEPCAVKLIFTTDLTEEVISRIAAEATLLSAVHSPNVVKIIGISVLPPSVCMVLELCHYGSLSDVLRGSESGRIPFHLSERDQIFLALGCARGVAALHALSPQIVHRDIKSFNFLVDSQFNAKLADLELGVPNFGPEKDQPLQGLTVDDFLVNWVAPEALMGEPFSQASDVYSLSLVFYEILTRLIPYEELPTMRENARTTIKDLVVKGYRPELSSSLFSFSHFLSLIERGWSPYSPHRPSAAEIVMELEEIYCYLFPDLNPLLQVPILRSPLPHRTQTEAKISHSLSHYFHKLSKSRTLSQIPLPISTSFSSHQQKQFLQRPSVLAIDNSTTNYDLYDTLPDIFEHMMAESSPWNDVFQSSESLLILSCCAPHVILHSSKTFLSFIMKASSPTTPSPTGSSPLRMLFGTQLEVLASPAPPSDFSSTSGSRHSSVHDHNSSLFQQFYTDILTLGSGQLVTSFYDSVDQPQLCLLHGYPIYNHDHDSPFDYSLYRPTRLSDRSSSGRQLSSISLSSSHYSTLEPLNPILNPSAATPKLAPTAREIQKSGQILYFVVAVSPLLLINESSDFSKAQKGGSPSVHSESFHPSPISGSFSRGSRNLGRSPRLKKSGSDGTVSQNFFLLYATERSLSVAEDQDQVKEKQERGGYDDPQEGALSLVRSGRSSVASWNLLDSPLPSKDLVKTTAEQQSKISAVNVDPELLNDL